MTDTPTPRELTEADKAAVRSTYDALQQGLTGFKRRGAQLQMIAAASRAFARDQGVAVIEAGTGTGKSLAYLTAGAPIARNHELKLVISTGTVALQEQLVERDIPLFLKLTGMPARVRIAKGRQRYVCTRNLHDLLGNGGSQDALFDDIGTGAWPRPPQAGEVEALTALGRLFDAGEWDGDMDTLPRPVSDDIRAAMTTTAGACENSRCAFFGNCPFLQARESMKEADIIVANHALLMADLMIGDDQEGFGGVFLPDPNRTLYVIDEGHHLAPIARDATSAFANAAAFHKSLTRMRNVIRATYQALGETTVGKVELPNGLKALADYDGEIQQLSTLVTQAWPPESRDTSGHDAPVWTAPLGVIPEEWQNRALLLTAQGGTLIKWIHSLRRAVREAEGISAAVSQTLTKELGEAGERLERIYRLWKLWSVVDLPGAPPVARWVTQSSDGALHFHASGVSSADFLAERLFNQAAGVVVTSATISAGGDFSAVTRDLGLPEHAERIALRSPFNLRDQGVLRVPHMASLPGDREAHCAEVAQWLQSNMDWSKGNLVIFTARTRMQAVYDALPPGLQACIRMQNTVPKSRLLAEHAAAIERHEGSTLFGMASFGEGLDLKGKLCTRVVIPCLPFQVPTDPVAQTHAQWIEERGGNSFAEVSVPEALRVLTQYCGRLIRDEDDVGEIIVLDRRLVTKSYGRRMLAALPPFRQVIEASPPRSRPG